VSGARRRPKLLVITQYYRPEPNFITADIAVAMSADCHVTVVTAHPNYPTGRFYAGIRSLRPKRSVEQGVTVWRLPLLPYHGNSVARRGLMYLSFTATAALVAPFVAGRPDVVWVYQTPFTTALAALWFRHLFGARLVYTCADLWPESLLATNVAQDGPFVRALFAYRRWINRRADTIVVSTRGTLQTFAAEGVPQERMHYVPVWVQGADVDGCPPEATAQSVVYAGNLGAAQRLDTLVRAAALIREALPDVTVDLYGSGVSEAELRALAASLRATNVRFHGKVAPAKAQAASRCAMAQVVSLQRTPLFAMTVPSKLAFCFAAGAPVLTGLTGEAAELAEASGGALFFDPDDPASLASAIRRAAALAPAERTAIRARMQAYFTAHFARETLLARYRDILRGDDRVVPAQAPGARAGVRGAS
jgi:colanic acid biosynthesis glycosyl transferase WcaI